MPCLPWMKSASQAIAESMSLILSGGSYGKASTRWALPVYVHARTHAMMESHSFVAPECFPNIVEGDCKNVSSKCESKRQSVLESRNSSLTASLGIVHQSTLSSLADINSTDPVHPGVVGDQYICVSPCANP